MSKEEAVTKSDAAVEAKTEEKKEEKKEYFGKPIQKGDLIKLDKLGRTKPSGIEKNAITFEVSNLEDAKKLPNFDPEKAGMYTPDLVVVGEKGFVLDKIDEELLKMNYGEERWVILEAKDGFGERKIENIERMSFKKFESIAKEKPKPGLDFRDEKGRTGHVISVDQGRIRVDFNHPLAGRAVEYRLKAIERIEKLEDKVKAFMGRRMPNSVPGLFKIDIDQAKMNVNIEIPSYLAMQQNMGYAEFGVSYELQTHLGMNDVNFIHAFKKQELPKEGEHDHEHDHEHEGEKVESDTKPEVKAEVKAEVVEEKKDEEKKKVKKAKKE
jgi:FKBP-type peptidyl-prolyl cis-trans isomerase 2